ncbi:hypothetical protein IWW34DRAFT_721762 [Fusarium oxysporum f. sp. albedinis]|nr:hypothetical protein IWW34DRAFT_721762 [Fusarium oxysporum f. sp. albedinis]
MQVRFLGWQLNDYLMPVTGVVFTLKTAAAYLSLKVCLAVFYSRLTFIDTALC